MSTQQITGVVFEPFQEVQHELAVVDKTDSVESYARVDFHPNCEAAINEQIKWVTACYGIVAAKHAFELVRCWQVVQSVGSLGWARQGDTLGVLLCALTCPQPYLSASYSSAGYAEIQLSSSPA